MSLLNIFKKSVVGKTGLYNRSVCLFCKSNRSPFDIEEPMSSVAQYGIYGAINNIYHKSCFINELENPTTNEMCDKAISLADLIEMQESRERKEEEERESKRKDILRKFKSPKSETILTNEELKLTIYNLECEVAHLKLQLKETSKELENLQI